MVSQSDDMEIRKLDGTMVAYQQFRGTLASIESVTSGVRSWVVTMGYQPQGPMAVEIVGDPTESAEQEYDMEVQLPVPETAKSHPSDRVQIKEFVPTEAAVLTLRGACELTQLEQPLGQLKEWMQSQNVQPGNAVRWVEVTDPAKVTLEEQVTELQYLVSRG